MGVKIVKLGWHNLKLHQVRIFDNYQGFCPKSLWTGSMLVGPSTAAWGSFASSECEQHVATSQIGASLSWEAMLLRFQTALDASQIEDLQPSPAFQN